MAIGTGNPMATPARPWMQPFLPGLLLAPRALAGPRRMDGLQSRDSLQRRDALQERVRRAARAATTSHLGQHRACFRTAESTANRLGGSLLDCPMSTSARGCGLDHLAISEQMGKLRPGMAIYMNLRPGTDPASLDLTNRPHWMTYEGKDADGTLRFADQYGADWTLAELQQAYAPRVIDAILDPLAARRGG